MCNQCNTCGGFGGCDPLLSALTNLFTPLCCCRNCGNRAVLFVGNGGQNGQNGCGCGCGCNGQNGQSGQSGQSGFGYGYNNGNGQNGCGCNNGNGQNGCGCGCGGSYDAYYVRQYALRSCCCCNN